MSDRPSTSSPERTFALRNNGGTLIAVTIVIVSLGWLLVALFGPDTAVDTPSAGTVVIHPARWAVALHTCLVLLSAVPALYVASALWLPSRPLDRAIHESLQDGRRVWPYWKHLYRALFVISLCCASLLAGYAYEALSTEIRLSPTELRYRAGDRQAGFGWQDIKGMALRVNGRTERLVVGADGGRALQIDLSLFSASDTEQLVRTLQDKADLSVPAGRGDDFRAWRRPIRTFAPSP